jgi:hypothetical protein
MRRSLLLAVALAPLMNGALAPLMGLTHGAWAADVAASPDPVVAAPRPAAKAAPPAAKAAVRPAPARPAPRPRVEAHAGYGRMVMPSAARGRYTITHEGDRYTVLYPQGTRVGEVASLPRNVLAMVPGNDRTLMTLQPGAQLRTHVAGGDLIIDIMDPPPGSAPAPVVVAVPPVAPPVVAPPVVAPPAITAAAEPAPPPAKPVEAAPAVAPSVAAVPAPAPVAEVAKVPGAVRIQRVVGDEPTILLPTDRETGLAAFRVGGDLLVVLDSPIDFQPPGGLLDSGFGQLSSRRTQDASVIRIPAPAPAGLRFARDPRGWLVTLGAPPDSIASIIPRPVGATAKTVALRIAVSEPSRVVTVLDPQTGGRLLVGTQGVPGEAVPSERTQVQFQLLQTLQGVVAAATSDDMTLRREGGGFTLSAGPHAGGTILTEAAPRAADATDAAPQSQVFNFPTDAILPLSRKLGEQIRIAAIAPAMARSAPRVAAAKTMLALGMAVEAQSVLDIATADDPALRDDPRVLGLRGVAAVLSNRPEGGDTLADKRLDGSIEVELWRNLLKQQRDEPGAAEAAGLARAVKLLLNYPPVLRERLLPDALEVMALNGQPEAAQAALLTRPDDRDLDLARAMVLEKTGHAEEAIKAYEVVAERSNRLSRYKALLRAVELRIKGGQLDAKAGADALDGALFGWRGAREEVALRSRIADLRRQAGQWREALSVLRDGRAAFPEDAGRIDQEIAAVFVDLFSGNAAKKMKPSDFVALYDQNLDLIKTMAWTGPVAAKLVAHLIDLGLQGRAEPILMRMVANAGNPAERALLGTRLASLRMTMDNPDGAIGALSETAPKQADGFDPAVMETRQLLYARAESSRGNKDAALTMLGLLDSAEADGLRADIHSARRDWKQATVSLASMEMRQIPPTGTPPAELSADQQALVMRLAQAATLANDGATLARVADSYGPAMAKGPQAAMFRLMTSVPVRGTTDLPRAFEEITLAAKLPGLVTTKAP